MHTISGSRRSSLVMAIGAASALALLTTLGALANVTLKQLSSDPYTNSTSQHKTQVEPDTFSYGATIVAATQSGRFYDGGSSDIGWATSTDNGATWVHGFLPGITVYQGNGPYDRVSDPSVAYDAAHNVWLIGSLPLLGTDGAGVLVNRSTNGGLAWQNPVTVASHSGLDKDWIVCDDTAASPYYGHCYVEWDDNGNGNLIHMSTSTDGGLTWGAAKNTGDNASGLGGQPVVQPSGIVVVPIDDAFESTVLSFISRDGGTSWSSTVTVSGISSATEGGGLRSGPLPSAEIDGAGKVYVVWEDCRFRSGCPANDIVMSTSSDGLTWSSVTRIPLDGVASGVDHFIPGLAVDKATSGATAHLGLTYYYYPVANCSASTCKLDVAFSASTNGGATWSHPTQLVGPFQLSWLPSTSQGPMVGDYISTSYAGGTAHPAFAAGNAPSGGLFHLALYSTAQGLFAAGPTLIAGGERPVPNAASDHPRAKAPLTAH